MKVENPHHGGWRKFEQQKFWTIRLLISPPPLCKLFFQFEADASAMLPMKLPTRTLFIASVNNDQTTRQQLHLQVQIVSKSKIKFENRKDHITSLRRIIPTGNTLKNDLRYDHQSFRKQHLNKKFLIGDRHCMYYFVE